MANKNFMYGIGAVKFKDFTIGYIEKGSWDMGGSRGEVTRIEAEQVPGTPVLVIPQSNGTVTPTFNVIQLDYQNLHSLLGGYLHYAAEDLEKTTPIGWTAPTAIVQLQGPWEIALVSGKSILFPNALLLSNLGGKLALTEVAKMECQLNPSVPEGGGQPYGVFDSDKLPTEWKQYKLPAPPQEEDDSEEQA